MVDDLYRFVFFNDTATTEIYTLSLHDALPISAGLPPRGRPPGRLRRLPGTGAAALVQAAGVTQGALQRPPPQSTCTRSEEHTSELQSRQYLVCRLLLEKKTKNQIHNYTKST